MKLRIKGNSIRLRLSEPEVSILANGEKVAEKVDFSSSLLRYEVQSSDHVSVDFINNTVVVKLGEDIIKTWAESDQVSISMNINGSEANKLSILVEKDFKCLTVRPEDESDLFPNPNEHH